jgi:hypothetical protein
MTKLVALWSLILSITLLGCSSGLPPNVAKTPSPYLQKMGNQTVALVFESKRGDYHAFCTGVWVGSNAILTAHHCVSGVAEAMNNEIDKQNEKTREHMEHRKSNLGKEKAEIEAEIVAKMLPHFEEVGLPIHYILENEVTNPDQEPTAVHLSHAAFLDDKHDLALLHADGVAIPDHEVAELADNNPALGSPVHVVGHVKGLYWSYIQGNISAYRDALEEAPEGFKGPYTQISAPVFFGNSGGGCFDEDGKLIGVVSFIAPAPSTTFLIGLKPLRLFLEAHLQQHD